MVNSAVNKARTGFLSEKLYSGGMRCRGLIRKTGKEPAQLKGQWKKGGGAIREMSPPLGIRNKTYSKQSNQFWLKLGPHKSLTAYLTGSLVAGCLILKINPLPGVIIWHPKCVPNCRNGLITNRNKA